MEKVLIIIPQETEMWGPSHIFSSITMLTMLYTTLLTSYIPNKLQESVSKQISLLVFLFLKNMRREKERKGKEWRRGGGEEGSLWEVMMNYRSLPPGWRVTVQGGMEGVSQWWMEKKTEKWSAIGKRGWKRLIKRSSPKQMLKKGRVGKEDKRRRGTSGQRKDTDGWQEEGEPCVGQCILSHSTKLCKAPVPVAMETRKALSCFTVLPTVTVMRLNYRQ